MQALFASFKDGLGAGVGAFLCGFMADTFSYVFLWYVILTVTSSTLVAFVVNEVTRSEQSDDYRPSEDSKAYVILESDANPKKRQR